MHLMVTRPRDAALRTATKLHRLGHEAIIEPMLDIVTDNASTIDTRHLAAILITSANAVRAMQERLDFPRLSRIPVLAVGDASARAARESGFEHVASAAGAIGNLIDLVVKNCRTDGGRLVYAAGRDRAGDLEGELRRRGYRVDLAIVYRAEPVPRFSTSARRMLEAGKIDGALFYSRRAARNFRRLLHDERLAPAPLTAYCLSDAVALPLRELEIARIVVAAAPDEAALLQTIGRDTAPDSPGFPP